MRAPLPRQESGCASEMDLEGSSIPIADQIDIEYMVSTLDGTNRRIVELTLAGESQAEIGRAIGLTRAAVNARLKRIVKSFREMVA